MKNKPTILLAGILLILSILACTISIDGVQNISGTSVQGSGNLGEEERTISHVSSVELAMPGTLHITVGESESLRIEAEDNLLEYIETDGIAGRLVIQTRPGSMIMATQPFNFYLTVVALDKLTASSSGDIVSEALQADQFTAQINSSGDLSIDGLDCNSLDVQINSSGNVTISELEAESIAVNISSSGSVDILGGEVERQSIDINSSGEYRASDVASLEADVHINSSGSATIRVSEQLTGSLMSSGSIRYIGDPEVDVSTSSSGDVEQIGE